VRTKRIIGFVIVVCLVGSFAVLAALIAWRGPAAGIALGLFVAVAVIGTYLLFVADPLRLQTFASRAIRLAGWRVPPQMPPRLGLGLRPGD
jgi:shikimate kinase